MNISKKERLSNIELLRIFAMILIVAHHFSVHGGFIFDTSTVTLNECWLRLLQIGGKIGVDVFILITGYFLVDQEHIKIKKLLKLVFQTVTYGICTYVIALVFNICKFDKMVFLEHLFPITRGLWWFATAYVIVYVLSPYINKFINSLSKKEYDKFLIVSFIMWSLLPTLIKDTPLNNSTVWFIFIYIVGAYLKKHPLKLKLDSSEYFVISVGLTVILFLWGFLFDILGIRYKFFLARSTMFYAQQTIPIILISICWFQAFLKLNIKNTKIINTISSTTFGIYLLHDSRYGRKVLWSIIFKNSTFLNSPILIPYSIMAVILVFIIGSIIEYIRINTLDKIFSIIIERLDRRINEKQKRIKRGNNKSII